MKNLNTLWTRYRTAESKLETDNSGRNINHQQAGATTRAFNRFLKELKKQKGYDDTQATNAIIQEWSGK